MSILCQSVIKRVQHEPAHALRPAHAHAAGANKTVSSHAGSRISYTDLHMHLTCAALTLSTYWSGRSTKGLPAMLKVMVGMVCSLVQSTTAAEDMWAAFGGHFWGRQHTGEQVPHAAHGLELYWIQAACALQMMPNHSTTSQALNFGQPSCSMHDAACTHTSNRHARPTCFAARAKGKGLAGAVQVLHDLQTNEHITVQACQAAQACQPDVMAPQLFCTAGCGGSARSGRQDTYLPPQAGCTWPPAPVPWSRWRPGQS